MKAKTILGIAFITGNNLMGPLTMEIVRAAITHAAATAHSMGGNPK